MCSDKYAGKAKRFVFQLFPAIFIAIKKTLRLLKYFMIFNPKGIMAPNDSRSTRSEWKSELITVCELLADNFSANKPFICFIIMQREPQKMRMAI